MPEYSPQKSSISTLVDEEPCETRKEISFWAGSFLVLLKSESDRTAYCRNSLYTFSLEYCIMKFATGQDLRKGN